MRMRLLASAAILSAAAAALHAQDIPSKKSTDDKPRLTVTGCVDKSWLVVSAADMDASYTERYKLRGTKRLMDEIAKNFDKHILQVTGIVTDTGGSVHRGKTIELGKKTRIYTGAKEIPSTPEAGSDPILDVDSFRDVSASCR